MFIKYLFFYYIIFITKMYYINMDISNVQKIKFLIIKKEREYQYEIQ